MIRWQASERFSGVIPWGRFLEITSTIFATFSLKLFATLKCLTLKGFVKKHQSLIGGQNLFPRHLCLLLQHMHSTQRGTATREHDPQRNTCDKP